jgi:hypothetical protein
LAVHEAGSPRQPAPRGSRGEYVPLPTLPWWRPPSLPSMAGPTTKRTPRTKDTGCPPTSLRTTSHGPHWSQVPQRPTFLSTSGRRMIAVRNRTYDRYRGGRSPQARHRLRGSSIRAPSMHRPSNSARNLHAHSALQGRVGGTGEIVQSQFDADLWRERADEARSLAQAMGDPAAKRHMHFIAEAYERLADHAERTGRRKRAPQAP